MKYHVTIRDRTVAVELDPEGVRVDGRLVDADLRRVPETAVHTLLADGASHRFVVRRSARGSWELHLRGRKVVAEVVDERTRQIREMTGMGAGPAGPRPVRAPMPGMVVQVEVEEGQMVEPGDGLAVVEAMKMENELRAEASGRVATIHVEAGQAVDKDEILIEFEPPEEDGP